MVVFVVTVIVVGMVVSRVVHRNVPVTQRVCHPRWTLREAGLAVAFKGTAHEHIQPVLLRVQNDGKRDVGVAPQMDLVCVRNVVDDEVAGVERLSLFMFVVVRMGLFSQHRAPKRHKRRQKEV
jgi:hypothetical protein